MRIKDNLGLRRGIQIKIYQVLNHEGGGGPQIAKPTFSTCGSILGSVYPALVVAMVVGKMITR